VWPWLAVLAAAASALWLAPRAAATDTLAAGLDTHARGMLKVARRVGEDPALRRLFEARGEALDPSVPFHILARAAKGVEGRTLYLADDRGRLVAWGGAQRGYPAGARPLGERHWGVEWSAMGAVLYLREPLLVEGRVVGAVTVADRTALAAHRMWGMAAAPGCRLVIGYDSPDGHLVRSSVIPGIELGVASRCAPAASGLQWLGWLVLAALAVALAPRMGLVVAAVGGAAYLAAPAPTVPVGVGLAVLVVAATTGRALRLLPARWGRWSVVVVLAGMAGACVVASEGGSALWLPERLLWPGWGAVWMLAAAWIASGWPEPEGGGARSLGRLLVIAAGLAGLGLVVEVARIPVLLSRAFGAGEVVSLPRGEIDLGGVLPAPVADCRLDDLAPALAARWGLPGWRTPSMLRLLDDGDNEVSRWGDLSAAGPSVASGGTWTLSGLPGWRVELDVATPPWTWLADWHTGAPLAATRASRVWFAVLTRSGMVSASLHPEIRSLSAETAGALFYQRGGWTWIGVDDRPTLARVRREGEWLVAAVGRYPEVAVWVLRVAVGTLWALLGLLLARPPTIRGARPGTFGGRLRLLVAGGVVVPLAVLTLFLHLRLRQEEVRLEQLLGMDALQSARYTAIHLGGGFQVNDDLARWLAAGWGGEVMLFDGTAVAAVSRPDLMSEGMLPELPATAVYPSFLIGRDEPQVLREGRRTVASGAVDLEGRRLLLELIRFDRRYAQEAPWAVDWLLTGAVLAALLALVLTARIESRLSASLRDLVALARRLLHGEPMGEVERPPESDLAEVLDAVRTMNEQVQRREVSLRHQEELLRITLSTLAPAVLVVGPDAGPRFSNPSAQHMVAMYADAMEEVLRRAVERGATAGAAAEETVQPVPGEDLTWRVGAAQVPLPDGTPGVVVVVDDVTDVVRVDRLRQLNQLARIVAHEVKNPLTPVQLWIQELDDARRRGDPDLEELVADACREIGVQVERLRTTANSFSNLVALERWEAEPVQLGELIRDTLSSLTILERRGIRVRPSLPSDDCAEVVGDRRWLQRALGNLVKNSVDALGEAGGEIAIRVECEPEVVILEVEDSAGGVPEHQLSELFSPHFSTTSAGSGLGLALVHQVVSRCQGKVAAANGDDGLVVRITLPRARGRDEGDGEPLLR